MPEKKKLNIHQRINAVMKDVSYVSKENKKVNDQYTFVSHDAVTAAIQPKLVEHGIVVEPSVISHMQDGNRTEVDIQVDFVNMDEPKDRISLTFFGYGVDKQDKGPGKAFSYAKKYAFLQLFCLETGDDPERDSIDHKPSEKKTAPKKAIKWHGPLNKTQLKAQLRSLSSDLDGVGDVEDFQIIVDSYAGEIEQVGKEEEMSDWFDAMTGALNKAEELVNETPS